MSTTQRMLAGTVEILAAAEGAAAMPNARILLVPFGLVKSSNGDFHCDAESGRLIRAAFEQHVANLLEHAGVVHAGDGEGPCSIDLREGLELRRCQRRLAREEVRGRVECQAVKVFPRERLHGQRDAEFLDRKRRGRRRGLGLRFGLGFRPGFRFRQAVVG